jgi:Mo-co oxidoreductase dimerisation domain
VAWSGAAPIAQVEVSINDGPWQEARLIGERHRNSWQWWELLTNLDQPGTTSIRARATDLTGQSQPGQPTWNRHGYGNNAVQTVVVQVTPWGLAAGPPVMGSMIVSADVNIGSDLSAVGPTDRAQPGGGGTSARAGRHGFQPWQAVPSMRPA